MNKTMEKKVAKAMEKEFDLNGYEIRNIYAVAKRRNKGTLPELESWYSSCTPDEFGFIRVDCHMMDGLTGEPLDDIIIECCMFDRRKSFICKTADEIK